MEGARRERKTDIKARGNEESLCSCIFAGTEREQVESG